MQHIAALFQQSVKELGVFSHVDLAGLGQLARRQHLIKMGQSIGIAAHVVHIGHVVHYIGVKQNRDMAAFQITVRHIHGRAAAQCKVTRHSDSPFSSTIL